MSLFGDVYDDVYGDVYGDVFSVATTSVTSVAVDSYATYTDMITRYDIRTIKDLVSDTGSPADNLELNSVLAQLLSDATGELNAAIMIGNTYTPDDIADLLSAGGSGAAWIKRIVCQITMALLLERRPEKYKSAEKRRAEIEEQILDPLRQGKRMFTVPGRSVDPSQTLHGDEIKQLDINETRPITDRTQNYYPRRGGSLPRGRF